MKSLTEDCRLSGRSLIYNRNNSGPSTVPWGTPDVTGEDVEYFTSQTTDWERWVRKDSNQQSESNLPWIPSYCNFARSRRWGTLSKAFAKSNTTACTDLPLSRNWRQMPTVCPVWFIQCVIYNTLMALWIPNIVGTRSCLYWQFSLTLCDYSPFRDRYLQWICPNWFQEVSFLG